MERLRETADAGTPAGRGQAVARDELGRRDQLGDEVGDRLEAVADVVGRAAVLGIGLDAEVGGRAKRAGRLELHG